MIGDVAALQKMVWFCISAIFRYYLEGCACISVENSVLPTTKPCETLKIRVVKPLFNLIIKQTRILGRLFNKFENPIKENIPILECALSSIFKF